MRALENLYVAAFWLLFSTLAMLAAGTVRAAAIYGPSGIIERPERIAMRVAQEPAEEAPSYDHRMIQLHIAHELRLGHVRELADSAFDGMVLRAGLELEKAGFVTESMRIQREWSETYHGLLLRADPLDVGDHPPLSQWIADWYAKLELLLGVNVMELSHLRDIWVLNYTLPVVFSADANSAWCKAELAAHPGDDCESEYRRHFAGTKQWGSPDPFENQVLHHGFAGVVAYWVTWAACEAATYGTGWFVICTPAGDAVEFVTEKWVAPPVAAKLWARKNP